MGIGRDTVRALMKGANDGAPKSTMIADLPVAGAMGKLSPAAAADMELDTFGRANMNTPPKNAPAQAVRAQTELPWRKDMSETSIDAAQAKLDALIAAEDEDGLKKFVKQYFNMPWKMAKDELNTFYNMGD